MTVWTTPSRPDSETEARYFMRHVVPIYFDFRKDGESKQFVQTSFAFSFYGSWLLNRPCANSWKSACVRPSNLPPSDRRSQPSLPNRPTSLSLHADRRTVGERVPPIRGHRNDAPQQRSGWKSRS